MPTSGLWRMKNKVEIAFYFCQDWEISCCIYCEEKHTHKLDLKAFWHNIGLMTLQNNDNTYTSELNPSCMVILKWPLQVRGQVRGVNHFVQSIKTDQTRLKEIKTKIQKLFLQNNPLLFLEVLLQKSVFMTPLCPNQTMNVLQWAVSIAHSNAWSGNYEMEFLWLFCNMLKQNKIYFYNTVWYETVRKFNINI